MATQERLSALNKKKGELKDILHELNNIKVSPEDINESLAIINTSPIREKTAIANLLKRPEIGVTEVQQLHPSISHLINKFSKEVAEQAEIVVKYEPYIDREQKMAEKIESLDNYRIHATSTTTGSRHFPPRRAKN